MEYCETVDIKESDRQNHGDGQIQSKEKRNFGRKVGFTISREQIRGQTIDLFGRSLIDSDRRKGLKVFYILFIIVFMTSYKK